MFNNKRIQKLENAINELLLEYELEKKNWSKTIDTLEKRLEEIDNIISDVKAYKEEKGIKKNSDEPWADFTVELTEDPSRVKVVFDWNKAMITELRRQGFNASTEEDIISSFFSRLISEHGEPMSYEQLEDIKNA